MVTRIRFDATGESAADVEQSLKRAAQSLTGPQPLFGEQVIQRNLNEPEDGRFAFEGRLIVHPPLPVT